MNGGKRRTSLASPHSNLAFRVHSQFTENNRTPQTTTFGEAGRILYLSFEESYACGLSLSGARLHDDGKSVGWSWVLGHTFGLGASSTWREYRRPPEAPLRLREREDACGGAESRAAGATASALHGISARDDHNGRLPHVKSSNSLSDRSTSSSYSTTISSPGSASPRGASPFA